MGNVPFGLAAYDRRYGRMPPIKLLNRFFEQDPTNQVDGVALLSRPPTTYLVAAGEGPIRATFTQEGTFSGALFVVSGDKLFHFAKDLTRTDVIGTITGDGTPTMVGTREYLFICDGTLLQYLDPAGSHARATLTMTGNFADTETVTLNGVVYTFKATLTGTPYEVLLGADAESSLYNLAQAINATPEFVGDLYTVGTEANEFMFAQPPSATQLVVEATVGGTAGNAYTVAETSANGSWSGATLSGGAADTLSGIPTPDDVGIISMCVLGGYVFCAAAGGDRIYWINPGELRIEPLNFLSAEALPDAIVSLMTVGDEFWAFGTASTQPFYLTGDENVVAPSQGRAFSRGALEGTAVLTYASEVCIVAEDSIVYRVAGGPERISNSGIEELIRQARALERQNP